MIDDTANEIKRITDTVNGYDLDTVKSADKSAINKLIEDIDNLPKDNMTDSQKSGIDSIKLIAENLIQKIDDTAKEIKRITDTVNGYDLDTVKSADKAVINKLIEDIGNLPKNNMTDSEKTDIDSIKLIAEKLIKKIEDTAKEIKRITDTVNGYDLDTVKSADKAVINKLIEDIGNLPKDNMTDSEKTDIDSTKLIAEKLIQKIDETAKEIKRITDTVNGYDLDTVKSADKAAINKLIEDIGNLPKNNMTDSEKTDIDSTKLIAENLIKKSDETVKEIKRITDTVNGYDLDTVKSADKAAINKLIEDIDNLPKDNMTDSQKSGIDSIKLIAENLIQKIDDTAKEIKRITDTVNGYDLDTVKSADKAVINKLIEDIGNLPKNNMTDSEKTDIDSIKLIAEKLIKKIEDTAKEIKRITDTVNGYDSETVELTDKEDLEKLISEIEKIPADNLTDEEKEELKSATDTCVEIIKVIDDAAKVIDLINSLPEVKDVKESDKDKVDEVKQAYNDLSAHQKKLVGTELSNKLVALETAIVNLLLKDKPTGTTIEAIGDTTFDINVVLVVKPVAPTENTKVSVTGIASGKEMVALYDISLMLGDQKIQPNGKVRVTLTLTDEQLKGYKDFRIVYVDQNGESTVIESVLNGNLISFETDHFSGYGVIGTKIAKETSPVTGDTSNMQLWFTLLFISGGALASFGINKKRKKANSK